MDILKHIKENQQNKNSLCEQLFFIHGTHSFQSNLVKAHTIIAKVSDHFNIPLSHIKVAGSAHLGISLQKGTEFIEKHSDLDLAIIDAQLYSSVLDQIYKKTKGYTNLSLFPVEEIEYADRISITNYHEMYLKWLTKGVVHPKYFPTIEFKRNWNNFFHQLTIENKSIFKNISACIYLSENSFKNKQMSSINSALGSIRKLPLESAKK